MSEVFVLALLLCNFGSTLARYWLALDIRIEEILARRTREIHSFFEPIYWKMCVIFKHVITKKANSGDIFKDVITNNCKF